MGPIHNGKYNKGKVRCGTHCRPAAPSRHRGRPPTTIVSCNFRAIHALNVYPYEISVRISLRRTSGIRRRRWAARFTRLPMFSSLARALLDFRMTRRAPSYLRVWIIQ